MYFNHIGEIYMHLNYNKGYESILSDISRKVNNIWTSLFFVCIYKFILDFIYYCFIGNQYTSFVIDISILNILNGWLICIIMANFIKIYIEQRTASAIIMIMLSLIYFIPITSYCGYAGGSSSLLLYSFMYWLILSFFQCKIPIISYNYPKINISKKIFYAMIIISSIITLYLWYKFADLRIMINIVDVYDVRAEAAEYNMSILLQYLRAVTNMMIPILIILALHYKRYVSLIWLFILNILAFSFAGDKSIVLLPIILICGYLFYRNNLINLIVPGAIILEIVACVEKIIGSQYLITFIFYRTIMVPAELSDYYYRFFTVHNIDIFRNGIMGKLGFHSAYDQIIPNVIGNNFDSQSINCNSGMLADVWANLGIVGIVIMPIILIVCFRLIDFVTYGIDHKMIIGIICFFVICFVNMSWSTVLLTKGVLVACIMFLFFPKETDVESNTLQINKNNTI